MSELVQQLRNGGRDDEQWFELAEQAAARIEALETALRDAVCDIDEIRRQSENSLTRIGHKIVRALVTAEGRL